MLFLTMYLNSKIVNSINIIHLLFKAEMCNRESCDYDWAINWAIDCKKILWQIVITIAIACEFALKND